MSQIEPKVVLVDENDNVLGTAPKLEAHQKALCHRAFSVFIFRKEGDRTEVLLQQRHPDKYHCGGLWTNTCCSHPYPNETVKAAAERRLQEEMGIEADLQRVGVFHYIAKFDNGLTENEVDHVFVGELVKDDFVVNPMEVADYQWIELSELCEQVITHPEKYTPWLKPALKFLDNL